MFQKISTGWALAKQSLHIIRMDKEMLIFPLLSGISLGIVSLSFIFPFWMSESLRSGFTSEGASQDPVVYSTLFLFYFVNYFVIMFFNSGLIGCAVMRLNGENPTVADGFKTAMSCLPQLFAWSLVSATVGMILKIIESRSEKFGQMVAGFLGLAWNVTTYFVLPILVVEKTGPFAAMKRSIGILKKTWGEALIANFSIGLIVGLFGLGAIIPGLLGFLSGNQMAMTVGILLSLIGFGLVALVSSAANTVIMAALFEYAGRNKVPQHLDQDLLNQAFSPYTPTH